MNFEQILLCVVVAAAITILGLLIRDTGPTWRRRIPTRWVWSEIDPETIRHKLHVAKVLAIILFSLAVPVVAFFGVYGLIAWLFGRDEIGLIAGLGFTWLVAIIGLRAAMARNLYVPTMVGMFVLMNLFAATLPLVIAAGWFSLSYIPQWYAATHQ